MDYLFVISIFGRDPIDGGVEASSSAVLDVYFSIGQRREQTFVCMVKWLASRYSGDHDVYSDFVCGGHGLDKFFIVGSRSVVCFWVSSSMVKKEIAERK